MRGTNVHRSRIAGLLALALGAVALLALTGVATAKDRGGDDHGHHGRHGRHHHHLHEMREAGTISSFDPATGRLTITLTGGETTSGLPRREEGDLLVFADSTGKEFKLPRSQIRKEVESKLSLMPSNFDEAIAPDDFNNLMAFLMSKNVAAKRQD